MSRRTSRSALLLSCLALSCLPASATASGLFHLTDLGVRQDHNGSYSVSTLITQINDRGQIVGTTVSSDHESSNIRAFLYDSRTGAVEHWGRDLFDGRVSMPIAINDHGQGLVSVRDPAGESYAIVDQGRVTWTSRPDPGLRYMAIGNDGLPRGYTSTVNGTIVALAEGDRRLPVPAFPRIAGPPSIVQMSGNGHLIGMYGHEDLAWPRVTAFMIKDGTLIDLAGRTGEVSRPHAVSDQGDVAAVQNRKLTLIDRDGERTYLAPEGVDIFYHAESINDSGQIVGYTSSTPYYTDLVGFYFDGEALHDFEPGAIQHLNGLLDPENPDWFITQASHISNAGQILATAVGPDDLYHDILLTPTDQPAPVPPIGGLPGYSEPVPVPEPTTLAIVGAGFGLLLAHHRRRRPAER